MADDKSKRGAADDAGVAGEETYEVEYFARKHGINIAQAKELIAMVGNSRARLDAAAVQLKADSH